VTVEAQPDLAERLKDVRSRAFRRAVEASADRFVVEVVDLAHDERQALLQRKRLHRGLEKRSGLAEPRLVLRALGIGFSVLYRYGLVRDPPAFLGAKVIAVAIAKSHALTLASGPSVR